MSSSTRCIAVIFSFCLSYEAWAVNQGVPFENGSFEEGEAQPLNWDADPGGTWGEGEAHHGKRYLTGKSAEGERAWTSKVVKLQPNTDYRLESWLRSAAGEAKLGVDLLNEEGEQVPSQQSKACPPVTGAPEWRYVAMEWNSGTASAARLWFWVKGHSDMDDVSLTPIAASFMGNKGVEPDQRGRIPFWSEEQNDVLLPGTSTGKGAPDEEVKREGRASLQLTPAADWYAWSCVNYGVPGWTNRIQLSAWTRCDEKATAQILACWTDDSQQVLRVDASDAARGPDWQHLQLVPEAAPPGAAAVRLAAVAKGGRAWFDEFDLERLRPVGREVRVFVNQIGCEQRGPKSAVIATNFFPSNSTSCPLEIHASGGEVVWRHDTACSGRIYGGTPDDWGWFFWRADFTSHRQAGEFRAVTQLEETRGESAPFVIEQGALVKETAGSAVDFFFIQRCGYDVPGWHKPCHLDDARLPDGTHLDAIGGWHSAGDYNKLMYEHGDGGVAFALLKAYASAPEPFQTLDRDQDQMPDVVDEALWGAKFVAKMQIPETGGVRQHINQGPGRDWMRWLAPDAHTDNVIGTGDDPVVNPGEGSSPLVIGAWARLATLLKDKEIEKDFLSRAERLWTHATKNGQEVSSPHLVLSAIELHAATGQPVYLEAARRGAEALLAQQVREGRHHGAFGTYGEITAGALAQLALSYPDDALTAQIKAAAKSYLDFIVSTAENPFGLSKQSVGATEGFFPPDMGHNFQLLARAWAAAAIYRLLGDERALQYAIDHVDWICGKNPLDLCMFEGHGSRNPLRYHHRYNMIPGHERGAVPGTIPNGMVRDMGLADRPGFDLSRTGGRAPSYRTSEPWLVHNLYWLLAVSEVYAAVGR